MLAGALSLVALGSWLATVYLLSTGRLACVGPGTNGSYSAWLEARKLATLCLVAAVPGVIVSLLTVADTRLGRSARLTFSGLMVLLLAVCAWAIFLLEILGADHFCT